MNTTDLIPAKIETKSKDTTQNQSSGKIDKLLQTLLLYIINNRKNTYKKGIEYWVKKLSLLILFSMWAGPTIFGFVQEGKPIDPVIPILAAIGFWFVTTGVLMFNDVCDSDIDAIVHPERPIPLGLVDKKYVLWSGVVMFILASGIAVLMNRFVLLVVLAELVLCIIHYGYTKRHLKIPASSEIITSLQWGVFPAYSLFAAGNFNLLTVSLLTVFIILADCALNIGDSVRDKKGDSMAGVVSAAVSFGAEKTMYLAFTFFILSAISAVLCYILLSLGVVFASIVIFSILSTLNVYWKLFSTKDFDNPILQKRFHVYSSRYFMFFFVALGIDALAHFRI